MEDTPDERLMQIAAALALAEQPGLEGEALKLRISELLALGEDRLRALAEALPDQQSR